MPERVFAGRGQEPLGGNVFSSVAESYYAYIIGVKRCDVVGSISGINRTINEEYLLILENGVEILVRIITVLLLISAAGEVDGIGVLVTGSPVEGYGPAAPAF